jgi:ubiquitin carboxyl-terminal hydrolase L3
VINPYARGMGLPEGYEFVDVLSHEDWALEMVPRPVHALLFLFPIKEASETHRAEEAARIASVGQTVDPRIFFTKQTIGNACGTIGILHTLANTSTATGGPIPIPAEAWTMRFMNKNSAASPDERAAALEADDGAEEAHASVVSAGQSAVVDDTYLHFVALVEKGGNLYELDGRKETPINHGPTTQDTFLNDAVRVVKAFMDRDPEELRFTMVAFVTSPPPDA